MKRQFASLLTFALLALGLTAGSSLAQDGSMTPAPTGPEPSREPVAPAPAAGDDPAPAPDPAGAPESAPAPGGTAWHAPVGLGVEIPAVPAQAAPTDPAPTPMAPETAAPDDGSGMVKAPAPAGQGTEVQAPAAEGIRSVAGVLPKESDFQNNPCRQDRDSAACAEFLYPQQCDPDGRDFDEDICKEFVDTNACTRDPDSEGCRFFTVGSCFDNPFETKCHFIRDAFFDPNNPCREDKASQACQEFASAQKCEQRALTGVDCDLYLLMLRSFTQDEFETCLNQQNDPFRAGRPETGSPCEAVVAFIRRSCSVYPPPFGCYPLEFGGTTEPLSNLPRDEAPDDGTGPVGGPGSSESAGFRSAIIDPGADDDTEFVSDEGEPSRRPRAAARLAHSGLDLAPVALLGLVMLGLGAVLRVATTRRGEVFPPW